MKERIILRTTERRKNTIEYIRDKNTRKKI